MYNMDAPRVPWECFNEHRNKIIDKYIVHSLTQLYCSELYLFILQMSHNKIDKKLKLI